MSYFNCLQNTLRISVCSFKYEVQIHNCLHNTLRFSVCFGDNYVFDISILIKHTDILSVFLEAISIMNYSNVYYNTQELRCSSAISFPMGALKLGIPNLVTFKTHWKCQCE